MVLWGVRSEGEEGLQVKCVYIDIYIYKEVQSGSKTNFDGMMEEKCTSDTAEMRIHCSDITTSACRYDDV